MPALDDLFAMRTKTKKIEAEVRCRHPSASGGCRLPKILLRRVHPQPIVHKGSSFWVLSNIVASELDQCLRVSTQTVTHGRVHLIGRQETHRKNVGLLTWLRSFGHSSA